MTTAGLQRECGSEFSGMAVDDRLLSAEVVFYNSAEHQDLVFKVGGSGDEHKENRQPAAVSDSGFHRLSFGVTNRTGKLSNRSIGRPV